ncbi:MAG: hypothetical protein F4Y39_21175 [Gemmatimonadetes bacterium]|nr:hypothetical protein [Gemmatimonadota bacterium]MYF75625.1 hypothetical protein [Gemmatimonadota bacterium]
MTENDTLTILAALYALDDERNPYEYRCKLARQILHSMTTVPGKPKQELTDRLKSVIDQAKGSPQNEKSFYDIMLAYRDFASPHDLVDMPTDCPALNGLLNTVEVAYVAWEEQGKIDQLEIVTGCGYDD